MTSSSVWSRTILRSPENDRIRAVAGRALAADSRYALDPLAHLEDGHVLILGLAGPDDDDVEETTDDDGETIRLKRVLFQPYQHEIETIQAWPDLDHLRATARTGTPELRFRNVHDEKSRQMGETWTLAYVLLWALIYHGESAGLAIHQKGSRVDDGGNASTPESIFGRIRFMAESRTRDGGSTWPDALAPRDLLVFRGGDASRIVNRLNDARLAGATATEDPGRSGTYTHVLVDEAARLPWGRQAQAALRSACPRGRFYVSTPNGEDNIFHDLREPHRKGYTYLRHHWSQHPIYAAGIHVAGELETCQLCAGTRAQIPWNATDPPAHRYPGRLTSPWYDEAVLDLTDEQVAAELDISYARSLEARIYPEFSDELHVVPRIALDPLRPVDLSFDFGYTTAVGIWQNFTTFYGKVGEVETHDSTPEQVAAAIREALADLGMPIAGLRPGVTSQYTAIGDPSGGNRERDGGSWMADLRRQGFTIGSQRNSLARTIWAVKRLLQGRPLPIRYSAAGCPQTIRHIKANRWPTDREGNRKQGAKEPENDEHNHMMRADAYLLAWRFPPPDLEDGMPSSEYQSLGPYRSLDSYDDVPVEDADPYRGVM